MITSFTSQETPTLSQRKNLYVDLNILGQGFFESVSELGLDIWSRMLPVSKGGALPKGFDGAFFDVGGREYIHVSNLVRGNKRLFDGFSNYDMETREVFKSLDKGWMGAKTVLISSSHSTGPTWAPYFSVWRFIPWMRSFKSSMMPVVLPSLRAATCAIPTYSLRMLSEWWPAARTGWKGSAPTIAQTSRPHSAKPPRSISFCLPAVGMGAKTGEPEGNTGSVKWTLMTSS
jgi:hypothetical protein